MTLFVGHLSKKMIKISSVFHKDRKVCSTLNNFRPRQGQQCLKLLRFCEFFMLAEVLNYKSDGNKNQEARSPLVENEVLVSVRAWIVLTIVCVFKGCKSNLNEEFSKSYVLSLSFGIKL